MVRGVAATVGSFSHFPSSCTRPALRKPYGLPAPLSYSLRGQHHGLADLCHSTATGGQPAECRRVTACLPSLLFLGSRGTRLGAQDSLPAQHRRGGSHLQRVYSAKPGWRPASLHPARAHPRGARAHHPPGEEIPRPHLLGPMGLTPPARGGKGGGDEARNRPSQAGCQWSCISHG